MEDQKTIICRFCLNFPKKYDTVDVVQEDMVQIVVPDMDLKICTESYICYECRCALQETFSFKSTCLEIEDTIHSYTNNGQTQINLDKITGLKDLEINERIEKYSKICRTCLNVTEPLSYIKLDNNSSVELEMMQCYLPEVDVTLTNDPIMCEKCQRLLKKYSCFYKTTMKNENRIKSFLQNTSKYFGRNFELINLFENHVEVENQSQILHEELNIEDDEIETKPVVDNMNSLEVESIIKDRNLETLANSFPKDKLLDELDTAIMTCEDSIAQNKSQPVEISQNELDKMIEVVYDSSDEPPIVEKPYNTRNKRKKIIIEPIEDNILEDPDFPEPFDDDSDDDYTEGSEEFRRLPKNRKTAKESTPKAAEKQPCKFCHKQVFSVVMIPHLKMCWKNPQNNFSVECVHCGVRMNSMQKLQQHTVHCKKYIQWKSKNDSLDTNFTKRKDNQTQESETGVYNIDQNNHQQSNHSDIQEGFSSNQNNDENINSTQMSGIGKILSFTTLAESNKDSNMDLEKNDESQNIENASTPKTVSCGIIKMTVDQNNHQQSNHSDIQEGFSSNQNNDENINSTQMSGIGKILSFTTLAESNRDWNMDLEKNDESQNIENASTPKTVSCGIIQMTGEVQAEQNVGVLSKTNHQSNQEDLSASTSSAFPTEKIHRDTMFINPITDQEIQPHKDSVKDKDKVEESKLNNASKDVTMSTITDQMPNQSEEVSKTTSMQLDDENGVVTSSTDGKKSTNTLTVTNNEIVESTFEDSDVIFVSETANTGQASVRKEFADSSNSNLPFSKTASSDITMTDYMKSELLRMSVTHIDELSSQFLGVLKCNKCNYNTRHLVNIENHVKSHFSEPKDNENYLCVLCHKLENGLYVFLNHMKRVHKHVFFTPFYWCVKCAIILNDIKHIQAHNCPKKTCKVKMFKSNGVIFCMTCKFETKHFEEGKLHAKLCEKKRLSNLQPTEFIEIDDDD